jgi:hypothetical protein
MNRRIVVSAVNRTMCGIVVRMIVTMVDGEMTASWGPGRVRALMSTASEEAVRQYMKSSNYLNELIHCMLAIWNSRGRLHSVGRTEFRPGVKRALPVP